MMEVKTRYLIIEMLLNNLEKKKFEMKIPEDFIMVDGFLVTTQEDIVIPNNTVVGRVSICLSDKMSNPVLQYVKSAKAELKRRKYGFQRLKEPLLGGTYIEGFYENFIDDGLPHNLLTVKIYLKGKKIYS